MIKYEILILDFEIKHKESQGKVTICLVQEDLGYILIHTFHYFKFLKI